MATKALTIEQCQEALDILARCGNMTLAASSMGMRLVHSEEAGIVEFRGEEFTV